MSVHGAGSASWRAAGTSAAGRWSACITPEDAGWDFAGLRVAVLPPGGTLAFATGLDEAVLLPLAGAATVSCDGERIDLSGRADPLAAATDFAYLPRDCDVIIASPAGGRFALASARARRRLAPGYGPASAVRAEIRGAGGCTRLVRNFCMPETFETDRLIACEVVTPSGNWSSYPPHKHDEDAPGESVLEEIYYFEIQPGPGGPGLGYQRAYGGPGRPYELLAEVRTGDVVLIPHGWHGPSMAAPGYDMYYLNVMAGPAPDRAWLACDDPAHAWVRGTWQAQRADPRLTAARAGQQSAGQQSAGQQSTGEQSTGEQSAGEQSAGGPA